MIDPIDDELTFRSHCDLIGRELQRAQVGLAFVRESRDQAKGRCLLLKAVPRNARDYLRELEMSL
jgi:hypothetical protein